MNDDQTADDIGLEAAARALRAASVALPFAEDLVDSLALIEGISARGFFKPGEDELLRELFASYLRARAALHVLLEDLLRRFYSFEDGEHVPNSELELRAFGIGFAAGAMLMRTAGYLADEFGRVAIVRKKLDEAEPRYGIPKGSFSQIFKRAVRFRTQLRFRDAYHVYLDHREAIFAIGGGEDWQFVLEQLRREEPRMVPDLSPFFFRRIRYRHYSVRRRRKRVVGAALFAMFEHSGRAIAELRSPHAKFVKAEHREQAATILQPGDVIVTRHERALSNLFLPGFWPHAALYIGTEAQRRALGLTLPPPRDMKSLDPVCVLEARKDGVLFRPLEDTLFVDYFTVIRPQFSDAERRLGLERAISHEGKLYDFEFDFTRADRLVCTELIYRAFDQVGGIEFAPVHRNGRYCVSAEDLLLHALEGRGFDPVALFGLPSPHSVCDDVDRVRNVLEKSMPHVLRAEPKGDEFVGNDLKRGAE